METVLFKVKAIDAVGRNVIVACGTAEQALVKAKNLALRGFQNIVVLGRDDEKLKISDLERLLD